MNDLHTTINGIKEEGGFRDYREWKGDRLANGFEVAWNGYPLPLGLRINVWKKEKERTVPKCAQLPL